MILPNLMTRIMSWQLRAGAWMHNSGRTGLVAILTGPDGERAREEDGSDFCEVRTPWGWRLTIATGRFLRKFTLPEPLGKRGQVNESLERFLFFIFIEALNSAQ